MGRRRPDALPRRLSRARPPARPRRPRRPHRTGAARAGRRAAGGRAPAHRVGAPLRLATHAGDRGVLELARLALSALVLGLAACHDERPPRPPGATAFPVPGQEGPRLTVEVLNASGKPGLARTGTRVLRQAGIDVVALGNAPAALGTLDTTRIVIRRALVAGAGDRIRRALGVGQVVVQVDSTKLLDASVLLGADFAPRLQFHP
ncbi:MAG: hypothetical protein DMD69_10490 [Gemmatimonadetes bacterium]|nr:MAG: hypothetical protein DMD69_10490 [Gemmatimonadota bacterium]PYP24185.1 MAG: hypothetical protein DMD55_15415 [Gemmatimonadota bacterium]